MMVLKWMPMDDHEQSWMSWPGRKPSDSSCTKGEPHPVEERLQQTGTQRRTQEGRDGSTGSENELPAVGNNWRSKELQKDINWMVENYEGAQVVS